MVNCVHKVARLQSQLGGLSQLGVEIPKGLQDVLGGIQGITSIVTGIASLVAMIEALTTVQTTESTIKSIPVIRLGVGWRWYHSCCQWLCAWQQLFW